MEQTQQKQLFSLIADILGVDDINEITMDAEFIADLNAGIDEIQKIIKATEEKFDTELGIDEPEELISVAQLVELVDESFI